MINSTERADGYWRRAGSEEARVYCTPVKYQCSSCKQEALDKLCRSVFIIDMFTYIISRNSQRHDTNICIVRAHLIRKFPAVLHLLFIDFKYALKTTEDCANNQQPMNNLTNAQYRVVNLHPSKYA